MGRYKAIAEVQPGERAAGGAQILREEWTAHAPATFERCWSACGFPLRKALSTVPDGRDLARHLAYERAGASGGAARGGTGGEGGRSGEEA